MVDDITDMVDASDSTADEHSSDDDDTSSFLSDDDEETHRLVSEILPSTTPQKHVPAKPTTVNDSVMLIVTEASCGVGQAAARAFCERCSIQTCVLIGRHADKLQETGKELKSIRPQMSLVHHAMDLGMLDDLEGLVSMMYLQLVAPVRYGRLIFVNSVPNEKESTSSVTELRKCIDLGVTSSIWMTERFQQFVQESGGHPSATCVNLIEQPPPASPRRLAVAAARRFFHTQLAETQNMVRVINFECARPDHEHDPSIHATGAEQLVKCVMDGTFENGSVVKQTKNNVE